MVRFDHTNYLIRRTPLPSLLSLPTEHFPTPPYGPGRMRAYPRFPGAIPHEGVGRVRVTHPSATGTSPSGKAPVRLACLRCAASVRPEPGSNSPLQFGSVDPVQCEKRMLTQNLARRGCYRPRRTVYSLVLQLLMCGAFLGVQREIYYYAPGLSREKRAKKARFDTNSRTSKARLCARLIKSDTTPQ